MSDTAVSNGWNSSTITDTAPWREVEAQATRLKNIHLRELFAADPTRAESLSFSAGELFFDFSKHRIDAIALESLLKLCEAAGLSAATEAMFSGKKINTTEKRAVLHTALRAPAGAVIEVDGINVVPAVHEVLAHMREFAESIRSGNWKGSTGLKIRNVVNIGIGGSDLGPAMAAEALRSYSDRTMRYRFVSNVDGADLYEATIDLDPAETLFIVSSKTFTTIETLTNARSAREWLVSALGEDAVSKHFVAVSTNPEKVGEFGIDTRNMFGFWDWVGGRYSMDSAIGLSLMCAIGPENFEELLAGFRDIDNHFRETPFESNVCIIMAVIELWYRNFFGMQSQAVLPYSQDLSKFGAYLQQLEMESNGKRVDRNGNPMTVDTSAIVWGTSGTNGQHAYYQMLHQGTTIVPCDFVGFSRPNHPFQGHHDLLIANLFAQTEALAFGKDAVALQAEGCPEELIPARTFLGNRPSTTIMAPRLTPRVLGQLIAAYEHKVFTLGVLWNINSFDQWGVELGKALATRIAPELGSSASQAGSLVSELTHDSSTNQLIRNYVAQWGTP